MCLALTSLKALLPEELSILHQLTGLQVQAGSEVQVGPAPHQGAPCKSALCPLAQNRVLLFHS